MRTAKAANKEVVLPFGDGVAAIEGGAAGRQHGVVVIDRLFHAFLLLDGISDGVATIFNSIGDDGPAVILAGLDEVHLVAAAGTEFRFPEITRNWMEREALHIAVSIRPNFREGIGPAFKRIAGRRFSICCDTQDFTQCRFEILSQWPSFQIRTLAGAYKQVAGLVE